MSLKKCKKYGFSKKVEKPYLLICVACVLCI